jgi:hypothetical protein
VKKLNDCIGEEVEKAVADAKNGEVSSSRNSRGQTVGSRDGGIKLMYLVVAMYDGQ